jgi:hypothetical protein
MNYFGARTRSERIESPIRNRGIWNVKRSDSKLMLKFRKRVPEVILVVVGIRLLV